MAATNKVDYLDGLRGVACFIVLIDHWFTMGFDDSTSPSSSILWNPWLLRSPLRIFVDGGFAVAIFFVLSGFVLLAKYFSTNDPSSERGIIYSAMIRRYPRLMIPSFTALVIYYSWMHFGPWQGYSGCHAVAELTNDQHGDISFNVGSVIFNGLIGQWLTEPAIYTIEWTLQIELLGSWILFVIAMCVGVVEQRYHVIISAFLLAVIPVMALCGTAPLPLQYLQSFLAGMFVLIVNISGNLNWLRSMRQSSPTSFLSIQTLLLVLGVYMGTCPYQITMGDINTSMWYPLSWLPPWLWLTAGATCVVVSLLTLPPFQRLLRSSTCTFLGRVSFAVYLVHYQVLVVCDILLMPYVSSVFNHQRHSRERTAAATLLFIFVIVPVVLLLSWVFTILVDEVGIGLAREFSVVCEQRLCGCVGEGKGRRRGGREGRGEDSDKLPLTLAPRDEEEDVDVDVETSGSASKDRDIDRGRDRDRDRSRGQGRVRSASAPYSSATTAGLGEGHRTTTTSFTPSFTTSFTTSGGEPGGGDPLLSVEEHRFVRLHSADLSSSSTTNGINALRQNLLLPTVLSESENGSSATPSNASSSNKGKAGVETGGGRGGGRGGEIKVVAGGSQGLTYRQLVGLFLIIFVSLIVCCIPSTKKSNCYVYDD